MRASVGKAFAVIGFCMLFPSCSPETAAPVDVTDAWIRKPVPPLDKTAGYFGIRNNTDFLITLQEAGSDRARSIEFHESLRDGDVMRMRRLGPVRIAPGETVVFEPGGKHLMIFGFTDGESPVVIRLKMDSGSTLDVPFEIR
jgi:copper(I)-binding protein